MLQLNLSHSYNRNLFRSELDTSTAIELFHHGIDTSVFYYVERSPANILNNNIPIDIFLFDDSYLGGHTSFCLWQQIRTEKIQRRY